MVDASSLVLFSLGTFWIVSAVRHVGPLRRGEVQKIATLHQDLAPTASVAAWQYKNAALALLGGVAVVSGWKLSFGVDGPAWARAFGVALVLEQLTMPMLTPRHWKSWTGVLAGCGIALLVQGLQGHAVPLSWLAHASGAAALVWALFAAGLVVISLALLPTWARLSSEDFLARFVPFLRTADAFVPWVGRLAMLLLAVALGGRALATGELPWLLAGAFAGSLAVLAISLVVNVPVNRRLLTNAVASADEVVALRARWFRGQLTRTVVALGVLVLMGVDVLGPAV